MKINKKLENISNITAIDDGAAYNHIFRKSATEKAYKALKLLCSVNVIKIGEDAMM